MDPAESPDRNSKRGALPGPKLHPTSAKIALQLAFLCQPCPAIFDQCTSPTLERRLLPRTLVQLYRRMSQAQRTAPRQMPHSPLCEPSDFQFTRVAPDRAASTSARWVLSSPTSVRLSASPRPLATIPRCAPYGKFRWRHRRAAYRQAQSRYSLHPWRNPGRFVATPVAHPCAVPPPLSHAAACLHVAEPPAPQILHL